MARFTGHKLYSGLIPAREGKFGDVLGIIHKGKYYIACKFPDGWRYTESEKWSDGGDTVILPDVIYSNQYHTVQLAYAAAKSSGKALVIVGTVDLHGVPLTLDAACQIISHNGVITNTGAACNGLYLTANNIDIIGKLKIDGGSSNLINIGFYSYGSSWDQIDNLYIYRTAKEGMKISGDAGAHLSKENQYGKVLIRDCGQDASTSSFLEDIYCDNNFFDSLYVVGGNNTNRQMDFYACRNVKISTLHSGGSLGSGVEFRNSANGCIVDNYVIGGHNKHGLILNGVSDCVFGSGLIHWNSKLSGSETVYDNIRIDSTCYNNIIASVQTFGVKLAHVSETPKYGNYGLNINSASCVKTLINQITIGEMGGTGGYRNVGVGTQIDQVITF